MTNKDGYTFDAKRKKETKNKVVFEEITAKDDDMVAVGALYVEKWLIEELRLKVDGDVEKIKVTIEVLP